MRIEESAQDYLESILVISKQKGNVRATDICSYFGYARATVSVYLRQLKENGYVNIDEHKSITLTDSGRKIAEEIYERHEFLTDFFVSIGVPKEVAMEDACRVEHYVSEQTFNAMKDHFTA